MSKRTDAPCRSGSSRTWLKAKNPAECLPDQCLHSAEAVVRPPRRKSGFDPTRTSPACRLSRLCRTAAILSYLSNALILQEPKQTERLVRSIRCKKASEVALRAELEQEGILIHSNPPLARLFPTGRLVQRMGARPLSAQKGIGVERLVRHEVRTASQG